MLCGAFGQEVEDHGFKLMFTLFRLRQDCMSEKDILAVSQRHILKKIPYILPV